MVNYMRCKDSHFGFGVGVNLSNIESLFKWDMFQREWGSVHIRFHIGHTIHKFRIPVGTKARGIVPMEYR